MPSEKILRAASAGVAIAVAAGFATPRVAAGVSYLETVDGDLSNDRFAPSLLTLGSGTNTITGTFGISATPDMPDLDYLTFTVPEGFVLDEFRVLGANVGGAFSFVGVEAGSMISIPWDWSSVESPLLGWAHFGSASVGLDLLPEMGNAPGAAGFDGPLGAGIYSLWIMELNTSREYSYSFGVHLTAVPAPGALAILSLAITIGVRRRRRARLFFFHHAIPEGGDEHLSQR